jgi:glutamate-5-semialdehyde dehydrogenase
MTLKQKLTETAKRAKDASGVISGLSAEKKNKILREMAQALLADEKFILKQNNIDIAKAKSCGKSAAFLDRLSLSRRGIKEMAGSLRKIANINNPLGEVIKAWRLPNGLWIHKVRVPIGVITIIYESRPNVTSDCIGLCFKSGNSLILRGGSESLNSNLAIYRTLKRVINRHKIPQAAVNFIDTADRQAVDILLKLNDYIDLVIPRGGEGLIKRVLRLSRIPVIKHYKGICHIYVDKNADFDMAEKVCFNAKVQRPGVCNAMESMLVHQDAAEKFLQKMLNRYQNAGVQIRGCAKTMKFARGIRKATEKDYRSEYLDMILSVKVVRSTQEAIRHINDYGSHHSDAIITKDKKCAAQFLKQVDSACVYLNASTRFTDGYQFGMGSEIGISTDKLHARGPMALEELTTYKYMIFGKGQIRE